MLSSSRSIRLYIIVEVLSTFSIGADLWTNPPPSFLRDRNFASDEDAIDAVEDYLGGLDSDFFSQGIESLRDRWVCVIVNQGHYIQ